MLTIIKSYRDSLKKSYRLEVSPIEWESKLKHRQVDIGSHRAHQGVKCEAFDGIASSEFTDLIEADQMLVRGVEGDFELDKLPRLADVV